MVAQDYESDADKEYVIRGNNAIMKCEIPSFVADFVSVQSWQDSNGNVYYPRDADYGNFSCVCFFSLLGLSVFFFLLFFSLSESDPSSLSLSLFLFRRTREAD